MRTKSLHVHHSLKENNIKKNSLKKGSIELLSSLELRILIRVVLYKKKHIQAINISSQLLMMYPYIVTSISLSIKLEHLIIFYTTKTLQRNKSIIKLTFYDLIGEENIYLKSSIPFVKKMVFKETLQLHIHLNIMVFQKGITILQ